MANKSSNSSIDSSTKEVVEGEVVEGEVVVLIVVTMK